MLRQAIFIVNSMLNLNPQFLWVLRLRPAGTLNDGDGRRVRGSGAFAKSVEIGHHGKTDYLKAPFDLFYNISNASEKNCGHPAGCSRPLKWEKDV